MLVKPKRENPKEKTKYRCMISKPIKREKLCY